MVAAYAASENLYFADFATTETATTPFDTTPLWSTIVPVVTGETGEYTPITISDDSSRAFYIRSYQYYTYLWGVNATTGASLFQYMSSDTQGSKGLGISASRDGTVVETGCVCLLFVLQRLSPGFIRPQVCSLRFRYSTTVGTKSQ
jgi:hypothetical protein